METPTLDYELFTLSGERGWTSTWYAHQDDESVTVLNTPYSTRLVDETRIFISTSAPKGITRRWTMKLDQVSFSPQAVPGLLASPCVTDILTQRSAWRVLSRYPSVLSHLSASIGCPGILICSVTPLRLCFAVGRA
ncbi:hypothetical protein P692DRAFT_20813455 [Suillus brevipes Sb2]|nr:hypothetical protein P692DRAFT_20813455 [Suillus brevipes Sb2]